MLFPSENEANSISIVTEEKDPGVVFDGDLKFSSHVSTATMPSFQAPCGLDK